LIRYDEVLYGIKILFLVGFDEEGVVVDEDDGE
jgi:hypothetical protein